MVPEKAIQNWCLLKTGSTCMVKLPYAQSLDGIHPEPWIDFQNFFLLLEFKTWKNNCPPRYSHNVHLSNLRNISRLHAYHASCMCSRLYMQYTLGPHRWRKSRQQVGWAVGELSSVVWAWPIFGWKIFDPQFVSQNVGGCIKRITPMKPMFHFFGTVPMWFTQGVPDRASRRLFSSAILKPSGKTFTGDVSQKILSATACRYFIFWIANLLAGMGEPSDGAPLWLDWFFLFELFHSLTFK